MICKLICDKSLDFQCQIQTVIQTQIQLICLIKTMSTNQYHKSR